MTDFKRIEECAVELITASKDMGFTGRDIDFMPATAARVSFANDREERTEEQDKKLINYLADHEHLTPFEYQHATLMIECPLFIRSQIHRHRTFSYNEISRRYTSEEIGFWIPSQLRRQSTNNRQGSDGIFAYDDYKGFLEGYKQRCLAQQQSYEAFVHIGVAREQARAELPQSLLTRFYMGGNLRNWAHFLKLRLDSHAQYEVQVIAKKAYNILHGLWPTSLDALTQGAYESEFRFTQPQNLPKE